MGALQMYFTTNRRWSHACVWCFWFVVLLTITWQGGPPAATSGSAAAAPAESRVALLVVPPPAPEARFPWQARGRWRKWAVAHYHAGRRAYQRAVWAARGARLLLRGALTMAAIVDWLTRAQLCRQLGALPVLYRLLEILDVRRIINRHCPSAAQVDHGAVVVVLVLNRLMAPRPLYKVADWLGQSVLVTVLGIPAAKFNDDRLGRTLAAIAEQQRDIWLAIVSQALRRFDIDLRFLFDDLTALVAHDAYTASALVDYGFAHNTPSGKPKVKLGVTASADGAIPADYAAHAGRPIWRRCKTTWLGCAASWNAKARPWRRCCSSATGPTWTMSWPWPTRTATSSTWRACSRAKRRIANYWWPYRNVSSMPTR